MFFRLDQPIEAYSENVFRNNYLQVHEEPNPGYQEGAMLALSVAGGNRWFRPYDWVIRLNPDVLILTQMEALFNN